MAGPVEESVSDELEPHFTVPEVAKLTKYKISTVRRKIFERRIGYKKLGKHVLVPRSEIQRLFQERCFPAIKEL